jgi:ABC-type lipoprotein export system ATPase subunit
MSLLHKLHSQGTTIVMVTHDPKIAAHTQRTINLIDGLVDNITHNGVKRDTISLYEKKVQHETL